MADAGIKNSRLRTFIERALLVMDYLTAVGLGKVPGHTPFHGKGRRDALTTGSAGNDISNLAVAKIPVPNQAGEQMTLVSTSTNDTAAGAGALTVKVHYLDSGGNYKHIIVTLNGTTPVNTSVSDIRFVQDLTVETLGTPYGSNAGDITIYSTATPANIFNKIAAGDNVSFTSARMVPAGYTFWLNSVTVSATSSKPVSVRLTATCDHAGVYTPEVFQFNVAVECQDGALTIRFPIPKKIPAFSIIKGVAISPSVGGGSASLSYDGWIE